MKKFILFLFIPFIAFGAINTKYDAANITTLDKNKVEFQGVGIAGLAPASTNGFTIDYPLTDDMFITGAKMLAKNPCEDDRIKVQVIFGTTIASQFIDWWSMDMDTQLPIPAKIPATHPTLGAAKIRVVYDNTCTVPVKVRVNLHLYKIKE